MPHPWMYFGEYLCICIMTDVGHQTCHPHLPWSTIFWSFWHNINSQSDQTKMYVNIFRLGGNIFCGYIDYFPWNTQLSPCMWWILYVYNSIFIYFMVTLGGRVVSNSPKFEMIVLFLHHFIPQATAAMNNIMRLSPILYYYFIWDRIN